MFTVRDYQHDVVARIRDEFTKHQAVLLQLATGGGKTAIAGYIAHLITKKQGSYRKGGLVLFLVHRRELIKQVADTLRSFELNSIGIIANGYAPTPWATMQIASIQTLARRLDKVKHINPLLVVWDEAHHIRAKSYMRVAEHFAHAKYLGLTATPARLDNRGLGKPNGVFDLLIQGISTKQLVDQGWLCEVDIYSIPTGLDLAGLRKTAGDFNSGQTDQRVTGPVIANGIDNWLKLAPKAKTIHFAVSRRHSRDFVERLKEKGIAAEHVDGSMTPTQRGNIFRRFDNGRTQVISNVDIVSEGFDCPSCECVVMGRPTMSETIYRQQAGRVMRPKADGRNGIILDLAGNLGLHGSPMDEVDWSLEDGAVRESVEKARKKTKACAQCRFVNPRTADACLLCGAEFGAILADEREIELIRDGTGGRAKKKTATGIKKKVNSEVFWTLGDEAKLEEIRSKHGYKHGVIRHWKRIFGSRWVAEKNRRESLAAQPYLEG